jgi:hypothetical protein
MSTVPYQTFIITPTLQLILQNYNEIMTAYNNVLLQYSTSKINLYDFRKFIFNADNNKSTDQTYYNDYENGQITAEVLADDYLTDLYTNIYSISETSPLLTEINTLEYYISKIQNYYNTGNIWYALYYLNNSSQSNGNVLLAYEVNSSEQYESIDVWSKPANSINNYQCLTITQITIPDSNSKNNTNIQINILVMNVNDVQKLENELCSMIENLENTLENLLINSNDSNIYSSLMNTINTLNYALQQLGKELNDGITEIIGLEATIANDVWQKIKDD